MQRQLDVLNSVRIASPCTVDWGAMKGDERVRHCELCALDVYNLSAMSREDARALVLEREGRLCVAFYRRPDGTMLTQDCPVGLARVRQKTRRAAARLIGMAAALLGLLAMRLKWPSGEWVDRVSQFGRQMVTSSVTSSQVAGGIAPPPEQLLGTPIMGDINPTALGEQLRPMPQTHQTVEGSVAPSLMSLGYAGGIDDDGTEE